ncbi:MAG: glycosyltransferase family 2 protein [Thermoplasmata archaeon]
MNIDEVKKIHPNRKIHFHSEDESVLVGIPSYNEEISIASLLWKINQMDLGYDVLVVDDGSHPDDEAIKIAHDFGATVKKHPHNLGKGAAIQTVFKHARKHDYDYMVLIDGDGQHNPYEIPYVLSPVVNPRTDMAIGTRWGEYTEMGWLRKIGKNVLDRMTIGGKGKDTQSGFRALGRRAIENIEITHDDFTVESEMIAEAHEKGMKTKNVPIYCRYKDIKNPSTKGSFEHGFGVLNKLIKMTVERRPLLFFGVAGAAFLAAALVTGLWVIHIARTQEVLSMGFSILTLIFVLLGSLLITSGFILNELKRLFERHTDRDLDRVKRV